MGFTECEVSGTVCPAWRGHSIVGGAVVWGLEVEVGSLFSFVSVARKNPFPLSSSFLYSLKGKPPYAYFAKILIEFQGYNHLCNLSSTPPSLSVPCRTLRATSSILAPIPID